MIITKQHIVEVEGEVIEGILYDLRSVFYVGDPKDYDPHTFSASKIIPPYLFVEDAWGRETETVKIKMGAKRVLDVTTVNGGIYMILCEKDGMLFEHPNGYAMYRLILTEDDNGNKVFDFDALMKSMGYVCRTAKNEILRNCSWEKSIKTMNAIASSLGVFYQKRIWQDCSIYSYTLKLARGALLFAGYSISDICVSDASYELSHCYEAGNVIKLLLEKPHDAGDNGILDFFEKYGTEHDIKHMEFNLYDLFNKRPTIDEEEHNG